MNLDATRVRSGSGGNSEGVDDTDLVYELPDAPGAVWLTRQLLGTWLAEQDVPAHVADDVVLACSELCTTALAAGAASVGLRVHVDEAVVVLEVDHEGGPSVVDLTEPSAQLARAVVDELDVRRSGRRTVLRCRKQLTTA